MYFKVQSSAGKKSYDQSIQYPRSSWLVNSSILRDKYGVFGWNRCSYHIAAARGRGERDNKHLSVNFALLISLPLSITIFIYDRSYYCVKKYHVLLWDDKIRWVVHNFSRVSREQRSFSIAFRIDSSKCDFFLLRWLR